MIVTKKEGIKQQHDPSVEPTQIGCEWVSAYQTSNMIMAQI